MLKPDSARFSVIIIKYLQKFILESAFMQSSKKLFATVSIQKMQIIRSILKKMLIAYTT